MFKSIKNLKDWYVVFMETGLILALLILLSAFKLELRADRTFTIENRDIDVIRSIEIPITENKEKPPAPAKPSVMIEVPNDEVLDVDITDLDIAWSTDDYVAIPNHSGSKDEEETVFVAVEEYPEIIGGMESLYDNIHYPQNARLAGIEGTVIVQFVVNKKGKVQHAKVIRGIGGGCDEAALSAIKKLNFVPGRQRGIAVPVRMSIPVVFKLQN